MAGRFLIALPLAVLVAAGCSSRLYPSRNVRESRCETVRTMTDTRLVSVPVTFTIPPVREIRRDVRDSMSVIENDYGRSSVTVHPDGSFDHSFETKPRELTAEAQVPRTNTVSETVRDSGQTEIRTVEVNVLHWWQKGLVWTGAGTLLIAAAIIVWKLFKSRLNGIPILFKTILKS